MISITIRHDDCTLTAEGHAGYAPAGQDIVCAGVSALLDTLAERTSAMGLAREIRADNGLMHIEAVPCNLCRTWIDFVAAGLQIIEEQFPDYIQVTLLQ